MTAEEKQNCMSPLVKALTNKIISMITTEVNKSETQVLIKEKIVVPLINIIYKELYPYIITLIITIATILIISVMTFAFFVTFYFKK